MPFVNIVSARYAVDAPVSTDLFADIIGNINFLEANQGAGTFSGDSPVIPNGSFEDDDPATVQPFAWTWSAFTGGTGQVVDSDQTHGAKSYQATHPGGGSNGGGTLTTDYFPVSALDSYELHFSYRATNPAVRVKVDVLWFDATEAQILPTVTVFDQNGSNPIAWQKKYITLFPVGLACFAKLVFTLGDPSADPGSSTNIGLDGVATIYRKRFGTTTIFGSNTTFTVPVGVTQLQTKVAAAGGGAAGSGYLWVTGGRGGYCEGFLSVTPGAGIPVVVGAGGLGGYYYDTAGGTGGDSSVNTLVAHGGTGGQYVAGADGTATGGYLQTTGGGAAGGVGAATPPTSSQYGQPGSNGQVQISY